MIAAAAAGLAAAALGVALWALWRGLRAQAATMKALREGLEGVAEKIAPPPPPPEPAKDYTPELDQLREDLTAIATHVGALNAGQADLRAAVGAAAAASLNDLAQQMMERMDEADKRAIARNETIRDEQQRIIEALEAAQGAFAPPSAPPSAAMAVEAAEAEQESAEAVQPADFDPANGSAAAVAPPPAAGMDPDALRALVRESVIEAVTEALAEKLPETLAPLGEDMLSALRAAAENAAQTAAQTAAETVAQSAARPARAPSIFNSGKVVSLIAAPSQGGA
jgi:hypothetical protein